MDSSWTVKSLTQFQIFYLRICKALSALETRLGGFTKVLQRPHQVNKPYHLLSFLVTSINQNQNLPVITIFITGLTHLTVLVSLSDMQAILTEDYAHVGTCNKLLNTETQTAKKN